MILLVQLARMGWIPDKGYTLLKISLNGRAEDWHNKAQ